jgi:hypothetical protein
MKHLYETFELFKFILAVFTTVCVRYINSSKELLCLIKPDETRKKRQKRDDDDHDEMNTECMIHIHDSNDSKVGYDLDNENDNHIVCFNWQSNNSL